jgi:hypothetical protein
LADQPTTFGKGGGGAGVALVVVALVLLVVVLFTDILNFSGGGTRNIQVGVDRPKVETPVNPAPARRRIEMN